MEDTSPLPPSNDRFRRRSGNGFAWQDSEWFLALLMPENDEQKRSKPRQPPPRVSRYRHCGDVAGRLEQVIEMYLAGEIDADEVKVLIPALKALASVLPAAPAGTNTDSIVERIKSSVMAAPELLATYADLLEGPDIEEIFQKLSVQRSKDEKESESASEPGKCADERPELDEDDESDSRPAPGQAPNDEDSEADRLDDLGGPDGPKPE